MPSAPDCDLHPYFRDPAKARAILDACIADNVSRGQPQIRVVHGKGSGSFRNLVHSHLEKHPDVEGFVLCDPMHGGDGATWVHLKTANPTEVKTPEHPSLTGSWRWLAYMVAILVLYLAIPWAFPAVILAAIIIITIELVLRKPKRSE
jgi:hypothetical protein